MVYMKKNNIEIDNRKGDNLNTWMTCLTLQSIFRDEETMFTFSNGNEKYEGVFKIYAFNKHKILMKKNGDVFLVWKSEKLTNKKLRDNLEKCINEKNLEIEGEYEISIIEDEKYYFVKMVKKIPLQSDCGEFAANIACERVFFLLDVNMLEKIIHKWGDM